MAGASWDSDDTIVFSDILNGVMQVSANGGTPETLIKASLADLATDGLPIAPQLLPDGDTLLFTNYVAPDIVDSQIVIHSLQSGEQEVLFKGLGARYLPTGHIVYGLTNNSRNNHFAVPFDLDKLKVTGGSISVLEGVRGSAFPDSGTLVYVPQPAVAAGAEGTTPSGNTLVWVDREGNEERLVGAAPDNYQGLKISPDGTKVALTINKDGNNDIWIWDIPLETPTKLTFDKAEDNGPIWTPDGQKIVFTSRRSGVLGDLYWKSANNIGDAELLVSKPEGAIGPWSFSRDGKFLATVEISLAPPGTDIGMLSMEGDREMKVLLQEEYWELDPQISPDGRHMAYQSDESGKGEIYVHTFPDVNVGRWKVSADGGHSPLWSPDGSELFYRNGDATMAVEVETEPTFNRGNPKTLFRGTYLSTAILQVTSTPWDIHPNGKKFLMITTPGSTGEASEGVGPQPKIIVVLNWFEELKERVPVE